MLEYFFFTKEHKLQVSIGVVEWLTLLLYILEVMGSNRGPETVYPD
jgi:hypothetical protein